jgi:hypothetical protein
VVIPKTNERGNIRVLSEYDMCPTAVPRCVNRSSQKTSKTSGASKYNKIRKWYGFQRTRPGGMAQDDGIILSVVLYSKKGNSFLLILDAKSFEEIAKAEAPHQSMISKQPTKCHLKNWIWRKCCQDF